MSFSDYTRERCIRVRFSGRTRGFAPFEFKMERENKYSRGCCALHTLDERGKNVQHRRCEESRGRNKIRQSPITSSSTARRKYTPTRK
ncbi:hypothetical protein TSAR_013054, partial [Trichomalopsis sarcophagae]